MNSSLPCNSECIITNHEEASRSLPLDDDQEAILPVEDVGSNTLTLHPHANYNIPAELESQHEPDFSERSWLQSAFGIDPNDLKSVAYLSVWAILGTTLRDFLGRIMGQDCEFPTTNTDFLTPFSKQICVTASGLSRQTGGALFTDLPSNMLGSFILATMTSPSKDGPHWPWFRKDHPLQHHDAVLLGIKVGFCGSLTTFSAWNTQMVTMLDGTLTELGPQVVPALFGYLIGVLLPVACFILGTHVHIWFLHWAHPRHTSETETNSHVAEDSKDDSSHQHSRHRRWNAALTFHSSSFGSDSTSSVCDPLDAFVRGRKLPFLLVPALFVAFVVADTVMHIPFYRTLWISMVLTPPGALLRWQMAKLNPRKLSSAWGRKFNYVPWGTLIVNIGGSILSALTLALEYRLVNRKTNVDHPWIYPILKAIGVGFCGSLTTISTFCRELLDLSRTYPTHAKPHFYALISVLPAMLLSLCVFSPIVRSA